MQITQSAIYQGQVRHRRLRPTEHRFNYRLFMVFVNLADVEGPERPWFLNDRRFSPVRFRREDHMAPFERPLAELVREKVEAETGHRPEGAICLLTHLRYFGFCFNPVSFYYCFDSSGERVEAIVAEVNNTPWGEHHCYVLDRREQLKGHSRHDFRKAFHVSPFMPMAIDYDWRFSAPSARLNVHMNNFKDGQRMFDATLKLERGALTSGSIIKSLVKFPFMTLKVVTAIYYQALLLKLKATPFYSHPGLDRSS